MQADPDVTGTIATPCRELSHTEYWLALHRLEKPGRLMHAHVIGWSIAEQRNMLVEIAKGDWLLFIDSDMVFPSNALTRLLARGEDKDIIGAVCIKKFWPFDLALFAPDRSSITVNDIRGKIEPFEVGGIGMAFTLIRRRVFEALELPYFVLGKWGNSTGPAEDLRFCEKAREAGFKVWADPTVRIGHLFTGAVSLGPTGVEFDAAGYRLPT